MRPHVAYSSKENVTTLKCLIFIGLCEWDGKMDTAKQVMNAEWALHDSCSITGDTVIDTA